MRSGFQKKFGAAAAVGAALVVFSWGYFSKKIEGYADLGTVLARQEGEITALETAAERMQTLKSLRLDLSLKLFGEDAEFAVEDAPGRTASGGALSGGILAAARKFNVEFGSMDQSPAGVTLRFAGRYPDVERFLTAIETDLTRVDGFTIEKSKPGGVILSLTVPAR